MNDPNKKGEQDPRVATVITAITLSDNDIAKLEAYLTAYFGRKIVIAKPEIDPNIIGGIIIKVDHKIIDGSVRSRLAALKKQLITPHG
jgi:F-type H+-transporting ATPase subunit delta